MITAYIPTASTVERLPVQPWTSLPPGAVWIDLLSPSDDERRYLDTSLALSLPTREEMREIEPSSRLYQEGEAVYMTATVISHADDPNPSGDVVTFVLCRSCLLTIRYVDPKSIASFVSKVSKQPSLVASPEDTLVGLLESVVDRIADILEKLGAEMDAISKEIFREGRRRRASKTEHHLRSVLRRLGRCDDLASTSRESLLSITRLVRYLSQVCEAPHRKDQEPRLAEVAGDVASLSEHAGFEAYKVQFLLDATLGMINIEQNAIIKIFSVVAVVFLPPTLVASIYGMNFKFLPELEWPWGYPFAVVLMIASAVLPYVYFKRKGWL